MRWALLLVLGGCRGLLGIDEGVVANDAPTAADDASASDALLACTTHAMCESGVCALDGQCVDEQLVAYVDKDGDGTDCTRTMPCGFFIDGVEADRPVIKVSGKVEDPLAIAIGGVGARAVYGEPGSELTIDGGGPVLTINGGVEVTIVGLTIRDGRSHGISVIESSRLILSRSFILDNAQTGVTANSGTVIIDRSVIADNTGTGIVLDGVQFSVTNSIITRNGSPLVVAGGADLQANVFSAESTFVHNTVADNQSAPVDNTLIAMRCSGEQQVVNTLIGSAQTIAGSCRLSYSLAPVGGGGGTNFTGATGFVSTVNPTLATYYRIGAQSAARDRGTPSAVTIDIDGDPRVGVPDVGAAEY